MTAGVGKRLSQAEKSEALRLYSAGLSSGEIGRRLGVTDVAIRALLRRSGIARRDASAAHRIYQVREDAFAPAMLTEDAEYWLGMLITDGSVYSGDGVARTELRLADVDKAQVASFRDFMGSDAPLAKKRDKEGNVSWSYSVRSARLAADLAYHGVTERKTFTAKAEPHLATSRSFWRGVVDGDGEIKHEKNFPSLRVLGTETLCGQFRDFCSSLVKRKRIHIAPMRSVYYVEMGGNDALAVEKLLYSGARYALKRKASKVALLLRRYADRVFRILPPRRKMQ